MMKNISFLGTGLLGAGFVTAMLRRGTHVKVWNRTVSKTAILVQNGAVACATPADAIDGADLIHIALKDDASVDDVLSAADPKPGQIIIDHTTTSKEGCIQRTTYWSGRNVIYQHVPVFMGPANAREGTGFMLISGDRGIVQELSPYLAGLTGKLIDLGDQVGKSAAIKLAGNAFLVCFAFGLREAMGVAKALDLHPSDLQTLFRDWNPASMTEARLARLSSKETVEPSWELSMARKDTGLFMEAANRSGIELNLLPFIAEVMDEWIGMGYGHHDWTIVGRDFH
jgi:3-hydroxyisobutyrate dehydrogenase